VSVWQRLAADRYGHVDRLRHEAANPICRCADAGVSDGVEGRCGRRFGRSRR
jgi:hypothetical protein